MNRYYMTPVRPLGPRRFQNRQGERQQNIEGSNEGRDQNQNRNENQNQNQNQNQNEIEEVEDLGDADFVDPTARLGKPKTLLSLWHEYLYGLDGNKPAKDFTPVERGRVKTKYSKRKSFWMVMRRLIAAGYTDLTAIQLIQQAYGRDRPVTQIIVALQRAKTIGYHPQIANVIGN